MSDPNAAAAVPRRVRLVLLALLALGARVAQAEPGAAELAAAGLDWPLGPMALGPTVSDARGRAGADSPVRHH